MSVKENISLIIKEVEFVRENLNEEDCANFVKALHSSTRIFCYGLGRAGFSMRAFTMRLMHMGKDAYFLTETVTPNYGNDDLFVVASASGETGQLVSLAARAKQLGGRVAVLTTNKSSTITKHADCVLQINAPSKNQTESSFVSKQPMASLYEQSLLITCDAVVITLAKESGKPEAELFKRHATLE